jgi:hypothetical protein
MIIMMVVVSAGSNVVHSRLTYSVLVKEFEIGS